jgi:hypothetical protein
MGEKLWLGGEAAKRARPSPNERRPLRPIEVAPEAAPTESGALREEGELEKLPTISGNRHLQLDDGVPIVQPS